MFPQLQDLPLHTPNVIFITTQELEYKYLDLTPKERENAFVKENGTTFLMKIGAPLKSGKPHDCLLYTSGSQKSVTTARKGRIHP